MHLKMLEKVNILWNDQTKMTWYTRDHRDRLARLQRAAHERKLNRVETEERIEQLIMTFFTTLYLWRSSEDLR